MLREDYARGEAPATTGERCAHPMTGAGRKVVCFAPRASRSYWGGEPWALLAASRFLVQAGYTVKIIQSIKGQGFEEEVRREGVDAIAFGVTCITGYAVLEAVEASRIFKACNPAAPVIWGGWHPSIMAAQVLACPYADIAVVGQGERTFLELLDNLVQGKGPEGVRGSVYKANGKVVHNPPREFEDINRFPPMPYQLLDLTRNVRPSQLGTRTIRYHSSQGCPHRCGFCVDPIVYPRKWSGLSAERVVTELQWLVQEYAVNAVIFTDSNFFTDLRRVHEIAELMLKRGLRINWGNANGRTHQLLKMSDETWQLLRDSGLKEVLVGAESALQEGLDLIRKDTTVEETVALSRVCNRFGILVRFSMMVGLPYDVGNQEKLAEMTQRELSAVLGLLDAIYKQKSTQNRALLFVYTPYPGTPLYLLSLKYGVKEPTQLEDWARFELNLHNTPWVPDRVIETVAMLNEYVFCWLEDEYLTMLKSTKSALRPLLVAAGLGLTLLAKLRWHFKFFRLPLDYKLFRFVQARWKVNPGGCGD